MGSEPVWELCLFGSGDEFLWKIPCWDTVCMRDFTSLPLSFPSYREGVHWVSDIQISRREASSPELMMTFIFPLPAICWYQDLADIWKHAFYFRVISSLSRVRPTCHFCLCSCSGIFGSHLYWYLLGFWIGLVPVSLFCISISSIISSSDGVRAVLGSVVVFGPGDWLLWGTPCWDAFCMRDFLGSLPLSCPSYC